MRQIQLKDAKATLSSVVDDAVHGEPSIITRHGKPEAVVVAEIEDGIAKANREKAKRKAADLTAWLETLLHLYWNRILAFDVAAARIAGALSDLARSRGTTPGFADIVIAATARSHGLTILTR